MHNKIEIKWKYRENQANQPNPKKCLGRVKLVTLGRKIYLSPDHMSKISTRQDNCNT